MNCSEIKQHLYFLAEANLDACIVPEVKAHLQECSGCSHVFNEINETLATIDETKKIHVDPWFAGRVEQAFLNLQQGNEPATRTFNPVLRYARIITVAASLAIALWLGIFIGSQLTGNLTAKYGNDEISDILFYDLVAEDIYYGSFETFFLTNGDQ